MARVATAAVATLAALEWLLAVAQPEGGLLGVFQIVAAHLALAGLVLIPLAIWPRQRAGLAASVALGVVVGFRFGGEWLSLPAAAPPAGARTITLVSWNLEVGARNAPATVALLRDQSADVIGLQELQPRVAEVIESDPVLTERYPYRVLVPRGDVLGLGLLSRLPIVDATFALSPAIQEVTIDLGEGGAPLVIIHAHPIHADIANLGGTGMPIGIDVRQRNADLDLIRARVDAQSAAGAPVLLVGDLNTATSEPAFDRLVRGLRDVHGEVGFGTGWTWRPSRLELLGIGLLRIDHVIGSAVVVPVSIGGSCPPVGDHCLVRAEVAIGR